MTVRRSVGRCYRCRARTAHWRSALHDFAAQEQVRHSLVIRVFEITSTAAISHNDSEKSQSLYDRKKYMCIYKTDY